MHWLVDAKSKGEACSKSEAANAQPSSEQSALNEDPVVSGLRALVAGAAAHSGHSPRRSPIPIPHFPVARV